jgi:hypothetical protein
MMPAPRPAAAQLHALSRYERKFHVLRLSPQEIEAIIRLHPAGFSEIYQVREINNIYLDTPALDAYFENLDGQPNRRKARIRWYGGLTGAIPAPTLEFKIRRGLVGWKEQYPLPPFALDARFSQDTLRTILEAAPLPEAMAHELLFLHPTLANRYRRRYFLSADRRFRLTLDWEMSYHKIGPRNNGLLACETDRQSMVVELKYGREADSDAGRVGNGFPFRMTRHSKYVQGVQRLHLV